MCDGYVHPSHPREVDPDIFESEDEIDRQLAPPDEYAEMEYRVPDSLWSDPDEKDVPTWLEAFCMTRAEWEAAKQQRTAEVQTNREAARLEPDAHAELARWRDEIDTRSSA